MEVLVKVEELALGPVSDHLYEVTTQTLRLWQISCFYCNPFSSLISVFGFECNTYYLLLI